MKILLQFPKLIAFACSIVFAYVVYQLGGFHWIGEHLNGASYPSMFVAGFLFSFGFTSPFAAAYFYETGHLVNPLLAAMLAAAGAMASDVGIFQLTRLSLHEEILRLKATRILQRLHALFHHERISERIRVCARWMLACIVIASPLPDEIGMTIVVGATNLTGWKLSVLCFVLNALGIFAILLLGRALL